MQRLTALMPLRAQSAFARMVFALPERAQRRLAGEPIRIDGQQLATELQLMLRLVSGRLEQGSVTSGRQRLRRVTKLAGGQPIEPVYTRGLSIPSPAGPIGARLYRPVRLAARAPLLVYYHGGGWVEGDLDTHDNVCRFLAVHSAIAVLAVDYRLAPECPFPAAVNDALVAFRHAVAHADTLSADPDRIAVGGDSAGANLAAVVSLLAGADERPPRFLLMLYPPTDVTTRHPSRLLFGDGFLLTEPRINYFRDHYLPDRADHADPRASPLLAPDLSRLPPTYLATAGFDPLRDEGEAFAARLIESGVPCALRRFDNLCHGFANVLSIGRRSREAMHEIAGALHTGLSLCHPSAQARVAGRG